MGYVVRLAEVGRQDVALAGGKGANLGELTRAGLPVPRAFVITTDAYRAVVDALGERVTDEFPALAVPVAGPAGDPAVPVAGPAGDPAVPVAGSAGDPGAAGRVRALIAGAPVPDAMAREITEAWRELGGDLGTTVAVRSSATAEDLAEASFAGQQDTFLNVRGEALLDAVRSCWASLWTDRAVAYRARRGIDPAEVALAVVVQDLVDADAAGVLFTADPSTGRRDQVVVSAAWGLGESVVSGAVTTDDLVLDKATGRVSTRTTADKAVLTVRTDTGTAEQPVPRERRSAPVLTDREAAALAALGVRAEQHFGTPQDLEWARADGELFVLQARPITALPAPEAPPPTDWSVPDARAYYFRASIVEQLPDPLSPLFAGLAEGSVTRSITALMRSIDDRVVRPDDVGFPTVNGYAYYRYRRSGLVRMTIAAPRALLRRRAIGIAHWRDVAHPRYVAEVAAWRDRPLADLAVDELLDGVIELLDAGTTYYTAVQSVIPSATTSEIAFVGFYDRLVRRAGDPSATTFLVGFDSAPILAEKSLHDLAVWTRGHAELAAAVRADPAGVLAGDGPEPADEWRRRFRAHLDRFGHSTYNLDLVNPTPAEDPSPLFEALRYALDGGAADPHERQAASAARREELTAAAVARLDPIRRAAFLRLLRWAQRTAPMREDALADIGLAWPQMRRMLAELGARLVVAGRIAAAGDVHWLTLDEVRGAPVPQGAVVDRQASWRGRRRATPPQVLPAKTVMDRFERFFPAVANDVDGPVLRGAGASSGRVTATARVLGGPADFGRLGPGDVLVASITTPAWTSLFARAAAVVTDIGGPLSHSSIVAREYGIPAVLGTGVATRRIPDGARVRVDGDAGTVTLLDESDDDPDGGPTAEDTPSDAPAAEPARWRGPLFAALAAGLRAWWRRRVSR